jgi:hypothetical protein
MRKIKIFFSLCVLFSMHLVYAKTVQSLGEVPNAIQYSEGKQFFAEQVQGLESINEFGALPDDIDKIAYLNWIAPEEDLSLVTLVGAKAWGDDNTYVGMACFARNKKGAKSAQKYQDTTCSEDSDLWQAKKFYLGVFKWQNNIFTPIARSGLIEQPVSWENSNLGSPAIYEDGPVPPQSYNEFDLANYRIAPDTLVFGVRAHFMETYSGGGAFFQALQLFMIKGEKIINIFSEPMYFYKDTAGAWHKDRTREHTISEEKNILMLLKHQTDGYYDIRVKQLNSTWHQDFIWSKELQRYKPK